MSFYVGQKVVCVNDLPNPEGLRLSIVKGNIYTIHALKIAMDELGIQLIEAKCPETELRLPFFNARRFRPIISKSTDAGMAMLREILDRESISDKPPIKRKVRSV